MAELPKEFPNNMIDVYRRFGTRENTIADPRVASSWGGGLVPEQHWGVLTDGRLFYLRIRQGNVRLHLAPNWWDIDKMPTLRGDRWLGPVGRLSYDNDNGWFNGVEDRTEAFTQCLDQVWGKPFPDEWELLR